MNTIGQCNGLDQLAEITAQRCGHFRGMTFDYNDRVIEGWFRFGPRICNEKKQNVLDLAKVGVICKQCDLRYFSSHLIEEKCDQASCLRGKSFFRDWLDRLEALAIKNRFLVRVECVWSLRLLKILEIRDYRQECSRADKVGSSWVLDPFS